MDGVPSLPASLHGLWRIMPSASLTEICALCGRLDFQILDCEHGAYDYATLLPDIIACERHGCAPLVRVSGIDRVEVQRCLDLGAHGIVFPQLENPADFACAAASMDHAPTGNRGLNPFVRAYGYLPPGGKAGRPWFVPIIETLTAARKLEEILCNPRIDLIYIGVYDLSAQLGCPGQMDAPELGSVVDGILAACRRAGRPVGMMTLTAEAAQDAAQRGVQALVHGVDTQVIGKAFTSLRARRETLNIPLPHPIAT